DSPVITNAPGQAQGGVVEAGNLDDGTVVAGTPTAGGTLTSLDVDAGATAAWGGSTAGTYGSFAITAGGVWTYTLNNSAADSLAEGTSASESFIATVTDDKGATATEVVTITITGTNDSPVITNAPGQAQGGVVEAGNLDDGTVVAGTPTAGGTLTSSDVDTGATAAWGGSTAGTYGSFAITAGVVCLSLLDALPVYSLAEGTSAS